MKRLYGEARQNGYIVENLESAVAQWAERLGAGPFFVMRHLPLDYFTYHGVTSEPDLSLAIGYMGALEIELIEQHNDAPSPYLDFAKAKQAGQHHISGWTKDYDGDMANFREAGLPPDCEGRVATMRGRFAYWHTSAVDGSVYELADLGPDNEFGARRELIRQASLDWDGSEPLRVFSQ